MNPVILRSALVSAVSYLLGSVSMAILFSHLVYHSDVRNYGSKNAGTTNMARVYGMGPGLATLAGDMLKTVLSILLGEWLLGSFGFMLAAVFCLIGHCWPVYYGFRGGKGVAVSAGIALMADWRIFLVLICLFFLIAILTRFVSLASLTVTLLFPAALALFGGFSVWHYISAAVLAITVWWMHRGNIRRLLTGTEPRFRPGSGEK